MKKIKCCLFLLLSLIVKANQPTSIEGIWYNYEKDAKIHIYQKNKVFEGKIIWLREPLDEKGNPRLDKNNPNPEIKKRTLQDLLILSDVKKTKKKNYWEGGAIYDPKSGKTYSCELTLENDSTLKLRGFIGISIAGRDTFWSREQ